MKVFLYPSPLHYRIIPEVAYDINATMLFGTNTFLKGYAKYAHNYDFFSIRYVCAGAEAVQKETREIYAEKFGLRILEGYGATETSPVISMNTPIDYQTGSVGVLLPGIEYQLKPVPGIEKGGQLFIKVIMSCQVICAMKIRVYWNRLNQNTVAAGMILEILLILMMRDLSLLKAG